MLQVTHVNLSIDKKTILNDVSVSVKAGELVGLIGPNGAGKSSLLRILAGLSTADSGNIRVNFSATGEQDLLSISAQQRARFLAYLAQQEKPAWPLTVEHLIGLGRAPWRKPLGYKSAHDRAAIEQAMVLTGLSDFRGRTVTSLSGGELQRCLLARIFAGEPQLILADEPIAALDPYHQLHIMELLQAHATQGGAVIAALHDLSLAARYCHRLILIDHGRVVADGEPVQVLTSENLRRVYGIEAHVDCREDGVVVIPRQRITNGHV